MRNKTFMTWMAGIAAVVTMAVAGSANAGGGGSGTAPPGMILAQNAVMTADWYFPTATDGPVTANGVIWLQRDGASSTSSFTRLATELAQQTNSVVVAPIFRSFDKPGASVDGTDLAQAVAQLFVGDRVALNISATAAGYQGPLPEKFLIVGLGKGAGFATEVGGYTVDNGAATDLLGVVMIDGVVKNDQFTSSFSKLDSVGIPDYLIAAPQRGASNARRRTAELLSLLHPDQFVGIQMPLKGRDAVIAVSVGWINDIYGGYGPTDPQFGVYGNPNDGTYVPSQTIMIGRVKGSVL
ncbi:MAG: hypothetical protein EBR07_05405 [Planctomycetes bacterium]|nr:hypothetical protein [Planctomycetota bacterium]